MNDFEVLSRDAVEPSEPVESKRDAETPPEPETVRRVRAELDALTAELAEAKETVAYLEARENELIAEKAVLARSLADEMRLKLALQRDLDVAKSDASRFRTALDAALNDVAIYRRAAFWFAAATLSAVVAFAAAF